MLNPTITVSDLDRVLPFYTDVLPFELVASAMRKDRHWARLFALPDSGVSARIATLRLGNETLELMDFIRPDTGLPIPADSHSNDGWFQHIAIVVSDMDKAYERLRQRKVVHISTGPQTLPAYIPAAAGVRAFYFRDPDGHALELISFPPAKASPAGNTRLPTGSFWALTTPPSVATIPTIRWPFNRDLLGLTVGGNSENYGPRTGTPEPGVWGQATHFRPDNGQRCSIELLDYVAPPGGRPYPRYLTRYGSLALAHDAASQSIR